MERYEAELQSALDRLRLAQDLVSRDLAEYPTPVSGCDAQYSRLIGDRSRIADAIETLGKHRFVATPRQMEPGQRIESR